MRSQSARTPAITQGGLIGSLNLQPVNKCVHLLRKVGVFMVQDMIGLRADKGDTGRTLRQPKTRDKQIRCQRPGEMSLHHGRCFNASEPNRSTDQRIGLAIRYVTPAVRDHAPGRDWAMPVRGEAPSGGLDCIAGPRGLFHPADLALYERFLAGQSQTLAAGAEGKVGMYATTA